MTRFRVAFTGPMGRSWYDVYSRREAILQAQAEKRAGARQVEVLEEKPWPPGTDESTRHFAANFERVWP